jgi:hypothetical protein
MQLISSMLSIKSTNLLSSAIFYPLRHPLNRADPQIYICMRSFTDNFHLKGNMTCLSLNLTNALISGHPLLSATFYMGTSAVEPKLYQYFYTDGRFSSLYDHKLVPCSRLAIEALYSILFRRPFCVLPISPYSSFHVPPLRCRIVKTNSRKVWWHF